MMSEKIDALSIALAKAQAELPPAPKNADNPYFKSRYADLSSIYEAIRSVLPKHGLSVVQTMAQTTDCKCVCVRTTLIHESGQWIAGELSMPIGQPYGPQQVGSAITYARRYSLSAIVGVVSEEDDDANSVQQNFKQPTQKPVQQKPAQKQEQVEQSNQEPQLTKNQITNRLQKEYFIGRHGSNTTAYYKELSDFFGKEVKSSKDLTEQELLEFLNTVTKKD